MEAWLDYFDALGPYLALAAFLLAVVLILNGHGRRLTRHAEWMRVISLRIDNLHKVKRDAFVRSLQIQLPEPPPPATPRPPPLSQAGTIEVDESWMLSLDTKRYPRPEPEPEPKKKEEEE